MCGELEHLQGNRVVTCFNAANHKQMTMGGRIVLLEIVHNWNMKHAFPSLIARTMDIFIQLQQVIQRSLAIVQKAPSSALPLDTQMMTDTVSWIAAVKHNQMIRDARSASRR